MFGWLPCPRCGAWGGGAVCPGCGASRGGVVPLDLSDGDGTRVLALGGPAVELARGVAERVSDPGLDDDALARLRVAGRLLAWLPANGPQAALWLDLRPASAGASERPAERDAARLVRLPWLVLRAGPREARVVRVAALSRGLRFQAGRVTPGVAAALDELALRGPEGVGRRALRVGSELDALPPLDPVAPWPGPLPPSAPGEARIEPGLALLQGAILSLLLLLGGVGLEALAGPTRADREPTLAVEVARSLEDPRPAVRREALLAIDALPPLERARVLRMLGLGDPDPVVRGRALELLEGDLGASCLVLVADDPAREALAPRLQALRLLRERGDPRAGELARAGLKGGGGPAPVRQAWAEVAAEAGDVELLHALVGDVREDARVRAIAGRALLGRFGPAAVPTVIMALRGSSFPPQSGSAADLAQRDLVRALSRVLTPAERNELRNRPEIGAAARRILAPTP